MLYPETTCPTKLKRSHLKINSSNLTLQQNRQPPKDKEGNAELTHLVTRGAPVSMRGGPKLNSKASSINSCTYEIAWIAATTTCTTATTTSVISVDRRLKNPSLPELAGSNLS